jgi:outer membrane biosynthesis protein TonB
VSSFPEKVRIVGRDLDKLLLAEKEKKKLSAAAHRSILDIRERYEVLLDEACRQNTVLLGRIEEARNEHVCRAAERVTVKVTEKKEVPPPKTGAKTKPPKKKQEEVPVPPPKKKGKVEGTFTEVVSKKRNKKKKAIETAKTVGPSAPDKTRRAIDKVKAKAPARAFIVSVGEAGSGEAKRQLWPTWLRGWGPPGLVCLKHSREAIF